MADTGAGLWAAKMRAGVAKTVKAGSFSRQRVDIAQSRQIKSLEKFGKLWKNLQGDDRPVDSAGFFRRINLRKACIASFSKLFQIFAPARTAIPDGRAAA